MKNFVASSGDLLPKSSPANSGRIMRTAAGGSVLIKSPLAWGLVVLSIIAQRDSESRYLGKFSQERI